MTKNIKLVDLQEGMEVAENILKKGAILIKKGTIIDKKIKQYLKKWNISEVKIKLSDDQEDEDTNIDELRKLSYEQFQQLLPIVANEVRFGFALHHDEDYTLVENLFVKFMSNPIINTELNKLKSWDEYSFLHSVDTFILGTLFAKKMKLKNIESFALGCLLHDIGKLKVPQLILQKTGLLTAKEFFEVKKHTEEGAALLKAHHFEKNISELALSHHERRDGSGYPNQITKDNLSLELEMLMIIDVYSALTMERPYHKGRSPISAINLFITEGEKFNEQLVNKFIEMLKIFPPSSIVSLSNNKKAKILYVNEKQPFLPLVEIVETKETLQLPINYSVYITKLLSLDVNEDEIEKNISLWDDYLSSLIKGQKQKAIHIFDELIDNKRIEEVYIDIITKSMKVIGDWWEAEDISIAEEHIASFLTSEILDYFKFKAIPIVNNEARSKMACITVEGEKHTLPLKIAVDILEAKGWVVYNLENPLPISDLLQFLDENGINKLGISVSYDLATPEVSNAISQIKEINENIIIIVGGSATNIKEIKGYDFLVTDMAKFDEINF